MDEERLEQPGGNRWEDVIEQQAAMAEDYRGAGWTVVELHPGDVAIREPADHDRFGFDVVVPGDEFEALRELVEGGVDFDGYELLGEVESSMAVVLVVLESTGDEAAVLYPIYFAQRSVAAVREAALESGALHSVIRPLDRRAEIAFTHEEPALFFGEESA
ncbi:MAG: hypothetical protein ACLFMX_04025 [Halobacteriales archaeon]